MRISRKIALLQIVLIMAFTGGIFIAGHYFWGQGYLRLEQDQVLGDAARARLSWEEETDMLGSLVGDWAPWDDLYAFAGNPAKMEFVEKNLGDGNMANLRINAAVITDPNGGVIFAKGVNLTDRTEAKLSGRMLGELSRLIASGALPIKVNATVKGFVVVDEQPVMFAMQRILTSDYKGPSPGALIFAKYADEGMLDDISRRTLVKVSFVSDFALPVTADPGDVYQEVRDDETVVAYSPLRDAFGNKGAFLVSSTPRSIYKQGQAQMRTFLWAIFAFGVLLTLFNLLFLDRTVLSRVRRLDAFMISVVRDNDFSVRIAMSGRDELSRAAGVMNEMLAGMEKSQAEINQLLASVRNELEERKRAEQNLLFLSLHDPLTGLQNRTFFEQELAALPQRGVRDVAVFCCDLDGLKLINDTLGHPVGDLVLAEVAEIIREIFARASVVARIGGDEFAIVLTGVSEQYAEAAYSRLQSFFEGGNFGGLGLKLHLSVGWAYHGDAELTAADVDKLVKRADDLMYRRKLSSNQSNRNTLVQGMMEMLKVRDMITEGHSQRLQENCIALGKLIGLNDTQLADISLLAQFHDIGKVGISDILLFKPGPFTPEERKEMERHSEIGHRIAQTVPELFPISDFILKHHEWWNGQGYPLGLKGEEIPIEDRILTITDAFDAMTSNRPYRQAMDIDEAIAELRRFAGAQFDPELVEKFIYLVTREEQA